MKKLALVALATFAFSAVAADPPKADAAAKKEAPAAPAPKKDEAAKPAAPTTPAAPAAAAPPPPAPELAKNLKPMEGKWKCEGKFPESAFGKAHTSKAKFEGPKSDLNGYFYAARYEETKGKDNPNPYVMNEVIGFDPSKSELVRTDTDGMGGITHLASKGWDGDKMVWSGETMAGPQKLQFKETQTKKSDKEYVIAMEMAGPDGTFAPLGELDCKK